MNNIAKRLKAARKQSGLNQTDMQNRSGVLQKDISRLESGKTKFIPLNYLRCLIDMGINLNWLFTGVGDMKINMPGDTHSNPDTASLSAEQLEQYYTLKAENRLLREQVNELKQEKKVLIETFTALKGGNLFK